jgi:hypothetical protein
MAIASSAATRSEPLLSFDNYVTFLIGIATVTILANSMTVAFLLYRASNQ